MHLFLICASAGGTILLLKLALSLLGLGFDVFEGDLGLLDGDPGDAASAHDLAGHLADHPHDSAANGHSQGHQGLGAHLGRILTFQAVVSFLAFFGIGGLATLSHGHGPWLSSAVAVATGMTAVAVLGQIFGSLRRLQTDGSVRLTSALGVRGVVYLRVPGHDAGEGKVTIPVQGRTIEVLARTPGPELRTGEPVVVLRVLDDQTVEVEAAPVPVHSKPEPIPE
jgi:hypothetical protein